MFQGKPKSDGIGETTMRNIIQTVSGSGSPPKEIPASEAVADSRESCEPARFQGLRHVIPIKKKARTHMFIKERCPNGIPSKAILFEYRGEAMIWDWTGEVRTLK